MRAGERVDCHCDLRLRLGGGDRRGLTLQTNYAQRGFHPIDFRQHRGQFLLQVFLGQLVVVIGEFAHTVLELQVAQVLVDRRLALIQVSERGDGFRFRQVLGTNPEDENNNDDCYDAGNRNNHGTL